MRQHLSSPLPQARNESHAQCCSKLPCQPSGCVGRVYRYPSKRAVHSNSAARVRQMGRWRTQACTLLRHIAKPPEVWWSGRCLLPSASCRCMPQCSQCAELSTIMCLMFKPCALACSGPGLCAAPARRRFAPLSRDRDEDVSVPLLCRCLWLLLLECSLHSCQTGASDDSHAAPPAASFSMVAHCAGIQHAHEARACMPWADQHIHNAY